MRQPRQLFSREPDTNKYDYGHVLIVGGSVGMSGAPSLAAEAALRCGAGLVTVAVPDPIAGIVAGFSRECMVLPLACEGGGIAAAALKQIDDYVEARKVTTCVYGCGAGRTEGVRFLLSKLLRYIAVPTLIDGDGLWALAHELPSLKKADESIVITPHAGEFARILEKSPDEVAGDLESLAQRFAQEYRCTVLVKGHRSLITDGERTVVNMSGNPGMATAGSGDVLSGMIAAFLAQGLSPYDAVMMGANIHGLAGDEAAKELGQLSLVARDIIRWIPKTLMAYAVSEH
jgi:NAD(P)H-hydrate epimerase